MIRLAFNSSSEDSLRLGNSRLVGGRGGGGCFPRFARQGREVLRWGGPDAEPRGGRLGVLCPGGGRGMEARAPLLDRGEVDPRRIRDRLNVFFWHEVFV